MFQDFIARKMLKAQGVPEAQVDWLLNIVKQNPGLFQTIALEIKAKVAGGMDQQQAAMEVMLAHQVELSKLKPTQA